MRAVKSMPFIPATCPSLGSGATGGVYPARTIEAGGGEPGRVNGSRHLGPPGPVVVNGSTVAPTEPDPNGFPWRASRLKRCPADP